MTHDDSMTEELLRISLQAAVPLWIERLRNLPEEALLRRAQECGQHIAEHGDIILYRGKKKGQTAEAFNRLAEGLACMSFVPGGVVFLGDRWEAKRGQV